LESCYLFSLKSTSIKSNSQAIDAIMV